MRAFRTPIIVQPKGTEKDFVLVGGFGYGVNQVNDTGLNLVDVFGNLNEKRFDFGETTNQPAKVGDNQSMN